MNATSTKLLATVTDNSSLIRPQFSAGLLLHDDDLTQVVDYMRDMTRLLFRTMLGCGVMCGFKVTASIVCDRKLKIDIEKGVALDCRGDLIELPGTQTIEIDPPCDTRIPGTIWVVIRRDEKPCAPRDVICSPQESDVSPFYTRIRDRYEIRILDSPPVGCCPEELSNAGSIEKADNCCSFIASNEDPCYKKHYEGKCACECICDCVVLAKVSVNYPGSSNIPEKVDADHSVRRFVRPVLMRDPLVPYKKASEEAFVANQPAAASPPAENPPTPPPSTPRAQRNR